MRQRCVQAGRDGDDPDAGRAEVGRPRQRSFKRRPFRRRIPFHQNELGIQPMLAALRDEAIDEMLHPALQVAAMIVVAGNRDDAEVGSRLRALLRGERSLERASPECVGLCHRHARRYDGNPRLR